MRAKGDKLRIIERRVLKMGAGENQVLKKTREEVKDRKRLECHPWPISQRSSLDRSPTCTCKLAHKQCLERPFEENVLC